MRGGRCGPGSIAAAAGLSTDKSKIEGLRSKLKRLAERGWLAEDGPGLFTLPRREAQDASYPPPGAGRRALLPSHWVFAAWGSRETGVGGRAAGGHGRRVRCAARALADAVTGSRVLVPGGLPRPGLSAEVNRWRAVPGRGMIAGCCP